MLLLDELLRYAVGQRSSDLHLKVGSRPHVRVDGVLGPAPFDVVEPSDTERIAFAIMPPERAEEFRAAHEADFVHAVAGLGRFRVSAFTQRGWIGLVLRRVLPGIPGFAALTLPPALTGLAETTSGLVLVGGLAGSGRTSTVAAVVDHVNERFARHVITIEDPIEVLHADKRSIVNQREIGADTPSFEVALGRALRQDPDVVVVGDLRDPGTARAALEAADTGHFVLATMSTVGAVDTVVRFVELFPPHQQEAGRTLLARVLRGIVCQRLVPRAGGRGRVPAVEVLVRNSAVAECLVADHWAAALGPVLAAGEFWGMQTFDQSLVRLYRRGLIDRETAFAHATYAPALRLELDRMDAERPAGPAPAPPGPAPGPGVAAGAPAAVS